MGKGEKSCFASLFGFKQQSATGARQQSEESAVKKRPPAAEQRYHEAGTTTTRVRPKDNDDEDNYYYGRYGYADRDIDKKAAEFIERVHRGMTANDDDQDR